MLSYVLGHIAYAQNADHVLWALRLHNPVIKHPFTMDVVTVQSSQILRRHRMKTVLTSFSVPNQIETERLTFNKILRKVCVVKEKTVVERKKYN